jgi:hypothetical protein
MPSFASILVTRSTLQVIEFTFPRCETAVWTLTPEKGAGRANRAKCEQAGLPNSGRRVWIACNTLEGYES